MRRLTATAAESDRNRPVKFFVRGTMGVSYHQFCQLKRTGGLHVNGQTVRASFLLTPGDLVEVLLEEEGSEKSVVPDFTPVALA